MTSTKKFLPLLLLFGAILIVVGYFYHEPVFAPNHTFMGGGGDGLKNYYTPWYHAKYDSSYTHFQGMNYPYGDHVVFADAQPLLSNAIKFLGLADSTVGIVNYALILSIFLSAWLLYRILRRWEINPWWAAGAAAAIALLSPQLVRMNGHYALAYTFVVPLIWHLVMRFFEQRTLTRSLLVALPVFLLGWLHPYFVMIAAVFLTAFWFFHSLVAWKSSTLPQKLLHFSLQVIVPVVLFTLSLKVTDHVSDRPANPYGIDQYVSNWASLIVPVALPPLKKWIPSALVSQVPENWEGIAYIGFVAILLFLGFWFRTFIQLGLATFSRRLKGFQLIPIKGISESTRHLVTVSVLAGVAIGIFACGFPFAIKPERLTELFPPIKQFRSLGRFIWVFYYTWVTFGFFLLWHIMEWLKTKGLRVIGIGLGILALAWTLFEGAGLNEGVRIRIWVVRLMTAYQTGEPGMIPGMEVSPWMASIQPEKYSAIVVLPYFHEGSENFRANPAKPNYKYAFEASIRTGLPMMDVMMSRTSLNQTWRQLQMVTEASVPLEILQDIHDPRPILAMRFGTSNEFDGPYMQRLGKTIFDQDTIQFYEIDLRAAQESLLNKIESIPDSLVDGPFGLRTNRLDSGIIWIDYEDGGNGPGFRSNQGKTVLLKENNFLHNGPLHFAPNDTIVVSLWLRMRQDRLSLTQLGFEEMTPTESKTWDYLSLHNNIKRLEGDWALCEREFRVQDPKNIFRLNVTTWKRLPPEITFDNILIRKKGTDVYKFENGRPIWKNNRYAILRGGGIQPQAHPTRGGGILPHADPARASGEN